MTRERSTARRPSRGRSLARLAAALLLCCAGGCRFLADEFTWYDRQAPSTRVAPDAPVSGLVERP